MKQFSAKVDDELINRGIDPNSPKGNKVKETATFLTIPNAIKPKKEIIRDENGKKIEVIREVAKEMTPSLVQNAIDAAIEEVMGDEQAA